MLASCNEVSQPTVANESEHLPLVFLHGWGSDSAVWQPIVGYLRTDFHLIMVDLPGFGESEQATIDEAPEAYLEKLVERLPPKSHIVGWSLGGMLATSIAIHYPDRIASLTTVATNAKFVTTTDWPQACEADVYARFLSGFIENPTATLKRFSQLQAQGDTRRKQVLTMLRELAPQINDGRLPQWENALGWLNALDNRAGLAGLSVPHFMMLGENDGLVPKEVGDTFIKRDYCSKLHIFSGTGHAPQLSRPELFATQLKRFVIAIDNPFERDKRLVAKSFSAAAQSYDTLALLQARVASRLLSLKSSYAGAIADLGCGTGFCLEMISQQKSFDASTHHLVGLDFAEGMLKRCQQKNLPEGIGLVGGDIEALPFMDNGFDGLVSSMSIQWCEDLVRVFGEAKRVLKPGAWILVSTLGPQTLHELRSAWQEVDAYTHINRFLPLAEVKNALRSAGFEVHEAFGEHEVLYYEKAMGLMRELKGIGAHNVNAGQNTGLTSRRRLQALENAYDEYRVETKGIPATYEVFYIYAKSPL